jgi:hypothetical protein
LAPMALGLGRLLRTRLTTSTVMAGLDPGPSTPDRLRGESGVAADGRKGSEARTFDLAAPFDHPLRRNTWMAGTSTAMTPQAPLNIWSSLVANT